VSYMLRGALVLLHRIGFTPQMSAYRAAQLDEVAIAQRCTVTWAKARGWR